MPPYTGAVTLAHARRAMRLRELAPLRRRDYARVDRRVAGAARAAG